MNKTNTTQAGERTQVEKEEQFDAENARLEGEHHERELEAELPRKYLGADFVTFGAPKRVTVEKSGDDKIDIHALWARARMFVGLGASLKGQPFDTDQCDEFPAFPAFLIQTSHKYNCGRIVQAPTIKARYDEKLRPVKKFGLNAYEGTGRFNKTHGYVGCGSSYREPIAMKQDDVKSKIRRLRPEEAEELIKIDKTIATLQAAVDNAKAQRNEMLRQAFRKGHTVFVSEVRAAADAKLAERAARIAAKS